MKTCRITVANLNNQSQFIGRDRSRNAIRCIGSRGGRGGSNMASHPQRDTMHFMRNKVYHCSNQIQVSEPTIQKESRHNRGDRSRSRESDSDTHLNKIRRMIDERRPIISTQNDSLYESSVQGESSYLNRSGSPRALMKLSQKQIHSEDTKANASAIISLQKADGSFRALASTWKHINVEDIPEELRKLIKDDGMASVVWITLLSIVILKVSDNSADYKMIEKKSIAFCKKHFIDRNKINIALDLASQKIK